MLAIQVENVTKTFGEKAAVGRVNPRHDRRLIILELAVVRQVLLVFPDDAGKNRRSHNEQQGAGGEYEADYTGDPAHLSIEAFRCARRRALEASRRTFGSAPQRRTIYEVLFAAPIRVIIERADPLRLLLD